MFEIGDVVRLTVTNRDADRNPVDGTNVAVSVTQPDGTAAPSVSAVAHDDTGAYSATFTAAQAGRHLIRWTASAPGAFSDTDIVDVWPADPRLLFTLEEARQQIGQYATDDDELLRLYAAAVTPVIEDFCGPLVARQRTRTFDGGGSCVLLPMNSTKVTVVESGSNLDPADFTVDSRAGIVYAGGSISPREFLPGRQNIVVTYTVGSAVIAPNVRMASLQHLRFLWQVSQQGPFNQDDEGPLAESPSGYQVPQLVAQLLGHEFRTPGFA